VRSNPARVYGGWYWKRKRNAVYNVLGRVLHTMDRLCAFKCKCSDFLHEFCISKPRMNFRYFFTNMYVLDNSKNFFLKNYSVNKFVPQFCFHFVCAPGLPDDLFSDQKLQLVYILEGLAMDDVSVFYGHLLYFVAICYILWPFCGNLVYISPFWYIEPRKIWQPWCARRHDQLKQNKIATESKCQLILPTQWAKSIAPFLNCGQFRQKK
jgi:hypothetical protein